MSRLWDRSARPANGRVPAIIFGYVVAFTMAVGLAWAIVDLALDVRSSNVVRPVALPASSPNPEHSRAPQSP